ncbi:MAG: hypothetical protein U0350_15330 [Caldilineaceae bacterium]
MNLTIEDRPRQDNFGGCLVKFIASLLILGVLAIFILGFMAGMALTTGF